MEKDAQPSHDVESGREGISHWSMLWDQGVVTKEMREYNYDGEGTEDNPYVVEWMENDPRNPMQWSNGKKWLSTILTANSVLVISFCSSAFSGGIEQIMEEFHVSQEVVTLGVSLFVLGFALGPLLWAPFGEIYGRQKIFLVTYGAFVAFSAGATGAPNIYGLLILRFLAAAFGSSPLANAGGVIADLFNASERGLAMSLFSAAPFMGPVLGPIIGGFLGMTEGWRWVHGLMAIWAGVMFILVIFVVPETYAPVLLRQRAATLSKWTGKVYRSRTDIVQGKTSLKMALSVGLKRPWILLFCEPIVFLMSLYQAIIYGILYMLFGAFPIVYRKGRGWNEGIGGLPFIAVALGVFMALAYIVFYENNQYIKKVKASGVGYVNPEARLPMCIVGGIVLPIGLFWFAWTNAPSVPWAVSVVAAMPFGFGMVLIFLSILNYLIDSYTIFAASVLAGNGVIRSVFGAAFPLFTTQMYTRLGIHWASTVPALLAVACIPIPFLFYQYGVTIRQKCKYAAEADAFMARIRNRQPQRVQEDGRDDGSSSRAATLRVEEEEEEVHDNAEAHPNETTTHTSSAFAEMKTQKEAEQDSDLKKVLTTRSSRSRKTVHDDNDDYSTANPYDIDYVNTRESFQGRSRKSSRASSLHHVKK
ncbi:hypothetical protein ACEQ8H_001879 [Pleosporales sp. CAS-2024a]